MRGGVDGRGWRKSGPIRGLAYGAIVGGAGAGLAGLFSLAWSYGGDYAARRIERLGEDEW